MHISPLAHVLPHAPQLFRSTRASTHTVVLPASPTPASPATMFRMQVVRPAAHDAAQCPVEQTCPAGHAIPHAPQFERSVDVFTQRPPQTVSGAGQVSAHMPPEHASPALHAWPHSPQLLRSDCTFTHSPPQSIVEPLHIGGRSIGTSCVLASTAGTSNVLLRIGAQASPKSAVREARRMILELFTRNPPGRRLRVASRLGHIER
jgi:hypothetical protein